MRYLTFDGHDYFLYYVSTYAAYWPAGSGLDESKELKMNSSYDETRLSTVKDERFDLYAGEDYCQLKSRPNWKGRKLEEGREKYSHHWYIRHEGALKTVPRPRRLERRQKGSFLKKHSSIALAHEER